MAVTYECSGGIAEIVIRAPETLNALDRETIVELGEAWLRLEADDEATVGMISGDGAEAFSSGADLKTLLPLITAGGLQEEIVSDTAPAFAKFVLSKPVIAAVHGICVAGGTELLQATDIRIASEEARFGLPEPRWGLLPAGGSTVRLARQIPYCHAMEILLTGQMIDAEQALAIGLVNRVVAKDEVEMVARDFAERIAANGKLAVREIKRSVIESSGLGLREGFAIESNHARRVFASADAVEGPLAFSEKRRPQFTGS